MKKVFSLLLMFIFIINVEAATSLKTYNESVEVVKTYINNFENNSRYISLYDTLDPLKFIFEKDGDNFILKSSDEFNGNGGLLNEYEYNIGKEYLFNGLNFWLVDKKIVDNDQKVVVSTDNATESGVRVTEFVKPNTKVVGEGTRVNPWEFAKRQYKLTIGKVENGTAAAKSISITEGTTDGITVTGNAGYAFDRAECDPDQKSKYEGGKFKIVGMSSETECDIYFENAGKTFDYKEEEQIFEVKYSGKYNIEALGAQGKNGGKGGQTSGTIYLTAGQKLYIQTGGTNGYNGGGTGQYSGGGATSVKLEATNLMIAAGGGGGKNGTAGGSGDSKGGESSGGTISFKGGGAAGNDGTNQGGGGSGYDYTYPTEYDECITGHNTCKGGTVATNCDDCYTETCVAGYKKTNCKACGTTKEVCKGGNKTVCNTCTYKGTTCLYNMVYNSSDKKCHAKPDFKVIGSCKCKNGKYTGKDDCTDQACLGESNFYRYSTTIDTYGSTTNACEAVKNGTFSVTGVCRHEAYGDTIEPENVTAQNCEECGSKEVYDSCLSKETECVRTCDSEYSDCASTKCTYGCDYVESDCATGENTCKAGWHYETKEYNSGHGGTNVLSDELLSSESKSGVNSGNGSVVITYLGES